MPRGLWHCGTQMGILRGPVPAILTVRKLWESMWLVQAGPLTHLQTNLGIEIDPCTEQRIPDSRLA